MFHGRYGNDDLNRGLIYFCLGLFVLNLLLAIIVPSTLVGRIISALSLICCLVVLWRMFSRNFEARARENAAYLRLRSKFFKGGPRNGAPRAKVVRKSPTFEERRKYKYFICTQCAQRLRVPRGKGKIRVTCTRCGNKIDMKS